MQLLHFLHQSLMQIQGLEVIYSCNLRREMVDAGRGQSRCLVDSFCIYHILTCTIATVTSILFFWSERKESFGTFGIILQSSLINKIIVYIK